MRHPFLFVLLGVCAPSAAQVSAIVETRAFWDPVSGERVDVNIAIMGGSVQPITNDHGFQQARVEAVTIIAQGDRVVDFRKAEIRGPEQLDSVRSDFIHQEHFQLPPGTYDLEVELRDLSVPEAPASKFKGPLALAAVGEALQFSDVQLADRIEQQADGAQNGSTTIIPAVSTYYPADKNTLSFYAELYNSDKAFGTDSLFLLTYQIEGFEDHKVFGGFRKQTRAKGAPRIPILAQFDIAAIPSGNFLLVFEARDRQGSVIGRREQFFQRNNPMSYDLAMAPTGMGTTFADAFTNADTLAENIRSMRPLANDLERKIIDDRWKDRDMDLMKSFFYTFWFNRNGYDPEAAWEQYHREVVKVNRVYGCRIKRGYETDRGRVHLQYGAPNTITDQPYDYDGVPYQIWHYYQAGKFSNKRFVFYLPDRVTGCYELLHSDMRGEVNNPKWNQEIHAPNVSFGNVQESFVPIGHGQQVEDLYLLPR